LTALGGASFKGHREIVEELLGKGADVNSRTDRGGTALAVAAENGHRGIVKDLLDKGAQINAANIVDGVTALIEASKNGHGEVVQALLDKGADVNARDREGWTAVTVARDAGTKALLVARLVETVDIQTDGYKENYRLGAAGEQLPGGASEVLELVLQASRWTASNKAWFDRDLDKNRCPQYPRIRELGEGIYHNGGMPAMWRACAFVYERTKDAPPSRTLLNDMWHGVGEWIA
jgi:ankyrin repeat protein